jgi:hypothetical protein
MTGKPLVWAAALIAISAASASSRDMRSGPGPASILARTLVYNLSEFYVSADVGVGWPQSRNDLLSSAKLGYDFWSAAIAIPIESPSSKNALRRRQMEMAAALAIPAAANKIRNAFDQAAPVGFGQLAAVMTNDPSPPAAGLAARLLRMGVNRQTRDTLFGPRGALSASLGPASGDLAAIGAVVQGVNDQDTVETAAAAESYAAATGPMQTYPMSAAALADQQSRAVRYGALSGQPDGAKLLASAEGVATQAAHLSGTRPRAFDASEGTPLDPLSNTTYDLTYPKVLPSLK